MNSSEEAAPQAAALRQNITSIQGSDEAAVSEVAEASEKSKASTLKSRLFANVLRGETTTFEQARKTAQKVSARTLQVGVGTVARGYVNSAVGADMMYVGLVLSNSLYPPTVLMGLGLLSAGSMLYSEGVLELTTGTIATGVGFTSLETSVAAGLITGAITGSSKSSENEIASSEASITASENSVGVETNADINTVDSTEANTIVPASEEAEVLPDITATSASAEETVQESPNTAVVNAAPNETEAPNNNNQVDELPESENKANTQETTSKENEEMIETQNPESDENVASEDPNARKAYDVKQDYSITGAVNATKTTIIATQDVLNSRSDARNNEIAFNQKISAIRKSDETAETNKNLAEAIVRQQQQRAAQITSQIENENVNIQKAAEEGNVAGFEQGQINVQNLAGSMEDMAAKESENFASSIDEVNDSISAIQADATNLRSELVDFNNKIDEQLDVSQKTIGVGAGTFGVGMAHGVAGSLMMQIGMQLELTAGVNVAQHIFAAMMMHRGTTMMLQGALEQESGLVASAAGTAGVAVHTQVNGDKVEIDSSESSGNSFLSITRSAMKLNDTTAQEVEESRQTTIDEVNLIAASATANANSVDKAETDDKAEKKLARFNKETEIESRKKRKKVIAVSASTRG